MKSAVRKTITTLCLLCLLAVCLLQPALAASGSCVVTSSNTAQPGGKVAVTVSLSGSNLYGFEGTLSYSSNLTFEGISQNVGGKWSVDYNKTSTGNSIYVNGQDLAMSTPVSDRTTMFTATFTVSKNAATNDTVYVTFNGIEGTDGSAAIAVTADTWQRTVAAPPSNNCDLKGITVTNATLSPAFSKNTTYYTCTVPYEVEKLNLDYFRADSGQTVNISGNGSFVVGENTVTLTVKAANGATKTYTIVVTRAQDPNYKASTDATLSALTMEGVTLSPAFNPNVTEYIGYVSHETAAVKLTGVAHDEKALKVTESEMSLMRDGTTDVAIVCTAEDGKTTKTYTVHVYRMPAYTGGIPLIEYTNEQDIVPEEEPIPTFSIPKTVTLPLVGEAPTVLVTGIVAGVVVILLFLLGFLIGRVRRGGRWEEEEPFADETAPLPIVEPVKPRNAARDLPEPEYPAPSKPAEQKKEGVPLDTVSLDQLLKDIHDM